MKSFTFQTIPGRTLACAAAAVIILFQMVGVTRDRWAVQIPDDLHTYGIRFKGGVDLFFTPELGWFLEHALWIFVALLIASVAVEWLARMKRGAAAVESAD